MIENILIIPVLPETVIVDKKVNEIIKANIKWWNWKNSLFLYNKCSDYNKLFSIL